VVVDHYLFGHGSAIRNRIIAAQSEATVGATKVTGTIEGDKNRLLTDRSKNGPAAKQPAVELTR
jgi:hypothetical protein